MSSPRIKNILVFVLPKSDAYPSTSRPSEGRSRVVTNAGRDAVDARASGAQWQSQGEMNLVSGQPACKMIGALADGEAVWFWHPLLVLNSRRLVGPTGRRQTLIRR